MKHRYIVTIDQPVTGDASDCIVNAIECVDDDHWRDAPAPEVELVGTEVPSDARDER